MSGVRVTTGSRTTGGGASRGRLLAVATAVVLALGTSACTSDDDGTTTTTTVTSTTTASPDGTADGTATPSEALCQALNQFQDSVQAIGGNSVDEIRQSVEQAQSDFENLRDIGDQELAGEMDQLDQAWTNLGDQLDAVGDGTNVTELLASVQDVGTALQNVRQQVDCSSDGE
jgi:hypothetical protein